MLTYERTDSANRITFHLKGALRLEEITELREMFFNAMNTDGVNELVLDLSQVNRLDASGVSLFVSTKNSIERLNGRLILTRLQPQAYDLFARTNLDRYFDIRCSPFQLQNTQPNQP